MNKQKYLHFNTHTCTDSELNIIPDEIQPDGILWEGIPETWVAYYLSLRDF
jgi:hypothetical protein